MKFKNLFFNLTMTSSCASPPKCAECQKPTWTLLTCTVCADSYTRWVLKHFGYNLHKKLCEACMATNHRHSFCTCGGFTMQTCRECKKRLCYRCRYACPVKHTLCDSNQCWQRHGQPCNDCRTPMCELTRSYCRFCGASVCTSCMKRRWCNICETTVERSCMSCMKNRHDDNLLQCNHCKHHVLPEFTHLKCPDTGHVVCHRHKCSNVTLLEKCMRCQRHACGDGKNYTITCMKGCR